MSRLLFWLGLAILVVFAIRAKIADARRRADQQAFRDAAPPPQRTSLGSEPMTSCAHCGLYFPASEAVHADGLDYCCPAHVRLPAR